jgi:ubiquinone/menaquinone biosynthesis C-methylase UbiE
MPDSQISGSIAPREKDYVLGTADDEIQRLKLQHVVWRPEATAAWQKAKFRRGHKLLDVGCGPGHATMDLVDIVGPQGEIVAIDQSQRFLDHLAQTCEDRRIDNVRIVNHDLATYDFEGVEADGAWLRWVLAFVPHPQRVVDRLARAIRPGGRVAIHEYYEYETWKLVPHSEHHQRFVKAVCDSWRATGGEPNVGVILPALLESVGFELESIRTLTDVLSPDDQRWSWPVSFVATGTERLVELGYLSAEEAAAARRDFDNAARTGARMVTPGLTEIIARKRD